MNVPCGLLTVLSLVYHTDSRCSPTSYYNNCWIRRFPGIFIDVEESQRRGAQLLKYYQEDSALKCSRTCCLTRNFSCNLAIFHYDTVQENVNCYHLHCPTLESCILTQRDHVVLYNVTKGVDPDLLVFGKYFPSNVRVLPHFYTRVNASEPLASDKRQFNRPPLPAIQSVTPSRRTRTSTRTIGTSSMENPIASTTPLTHATPLSSPAELSRPRTRALTINIPSTVPGVSVTTQTTHPLMAETSGQADYNVLTAETTQARASTMKDATSTQVNPSSSQNGPSAHFDLYATTSTSNSFLANIESVNQHPNETKEGNLGRNHTMASEGSQGFNGMGILGPDWHVAGHTLLVVVATCVTVLLSCCCAILAVMSWRGRRKRTGRYRTTWRGKGGSMRLIKYVLIRESS